MWQGILIGAVVASIIAWIIWPQRPGDGIAVLRSLSRSRVDSAKVGATGIVAVGFAVAIVAAWLSFVIIAAIVLSRAIF